MTNRFKLTSFLLAAMVATSGWSVTRAAERPTLKNTCDPRPDILPHPFYHQRTEYRRQYNRPRYVTGWLAYKIEPTSQEAMVWYENYRAGVYDQKHAPARYKRYFGPKPWEALQIGARPDFQQVSKQAVPMPQSPITNQAPEEPQNLVEDDNADTSSSRSTGPAVPPPAEAPSPSDRQP